MPSQIDAINIALALIGAQATVSNINEGSPEANTAALLYQPKLEDVSRAVHWNCLRFQSGLTLLKAAAGTPSNPQGNLPTPPVPWLYSYAYPNDCLAARYILPYVRSDVSPPFTTGELSAPLFLPNLAVPFAVALDNDTSGNPQRVILTNAAQAILVYTRRINDPNLWDPHFYTAFTTVLGAWFVNPLNRNAQLMRDLSSAVVSMISQARVSDGNEGIATQDHIPDWIRVRGIGGQFLFNNPYVMSWAPLALPGGAYV